MPLANSIVISAPSIYSPFLLIGEDRLRSATLPLCARERETWSKSATPRPAKIGAPKALGIMEKKTVLKIEHSHSRIIKTDAYKNELVSSKATTFCFDSGAFGTPNIVCPQHYGIVKIVNRTFN